MVAARRLRKSMLRENSNLESIGNIDLSDYTHKKRRNEDIYIKDNLGTFEDDNVAKLHFSVKTIIKIFLSLVIIFSCLCAKLFFKEEAKSNKYIGYVIAEYNKDYCKEGILEKFEDVIFNIYSSLKYIVPEGMANSIKDKYLASIKPKIIGFEVKEVFNNIFTTTKTQNTVINNDDVEKEENVNTQNSAMGGGGPIEAALQDVNDDESNEIKENILKILSKNIEIRKPVEGVLTSAYGDREEIFEGVNPYHTGIDIANKLETPIKSATCGKVTKVEENNKYYGNTVEIETDGVVFKYAHLQTIAVKEEQEVNFDTIIGYMGSTGMSTGSHLHFEIRLNGICVDPQQIIGFY